MKISFSRARLGSAIAFTFIALALPAAAFALTANVSIGNNYFSPQSLTINVGDTVSWINQGGNVHTVTSDSGYFNSSTMQPNGVFSATFNTTGTYGYHDQTYGSVGTGMYGTITVVQSGAVNSSTQTQTGQTTQTISNSTTGSIPVAANGGSSVGGSAGTSGTSATAAQLTAEVQALIAQIDAIQSGQTGSVQTSVSAGTAGSCPQIGENLLPGSSGTDVSRLQQFLAADPSIYPEGLVTGYYGSLTESAVERWQTKFNIVSSGTPQTTGFGMVGPRTAAAIAIVCGGGSYNGISETSNANANANTSAANASSGNATVSGFIQVTPVSGQAPLSVSVITTVNTANSCVGATYILNFGDGTASQLLPVPAGDCSQASQTITHTYQYGGTYQVTLTAGSHTTSATVTVYGTAAPVSGSTVSTQTTNSNLPAETLNASATSGSAPLTVNFTGVVTSNDAGFCSGTACSDEIDFGDGTTGNVTLPSSTGSWIDYSIQHTYTTPGGFAATLYQGKEAAGQPQVGSVTITVSPGSASAYAPPTFTPDVGGNPLAVSLQFNQQSSCDPYQINWGDGSAPTAFGNSSGTTNCSLAAQTATAPHTYAAAGSYTITLLRGTNLSQSNSVAVTISN